MNRNQKITIAVLRGWTLKQVGGCFSITPERVRQVVARTVRICDKNLFMLLSVGSVKEYRKHKNKIIFSITNH